MSEQIYWGLRKILRTGLTASFALLIMPSLVAGCASKKIVKPDDIYRSNLEKPPITDPSREDELYKIWHDVSYATHARTISDQRVAITAKGSYLGNKHYSETNFFIRAAAKTMRDGYDGFAIIHMDYKNVGIGALSPFPSIGFSDDIWIGSYEALRQDLQEKSVFSGSKNSGQKTMDGVIIMLNEQDYAARPRFNAREVYVNYLTQRAGD